MSEENRANAYQFEKRFLFFCYYFKCVSQNSFQIIEINNKCYAEKNIINLHIPIDIDFENSHLQFLLIIIISSLWQFLSLDLLIFLSTKILHGYIHKVSLLGT